jgi:hypothetical protein
MERHDYTSTCSIPTYPNAMTASETLLCDRGSINLILPILTCKYWVVTIQNFFLFYESAAGAA